MAGAGPVRGTPVPGHADEGDVELAGSATWGRRMKVAIAPKRGTSAASTGCGWDFAIGIRLKNRLEGSP